MKDEQVITPEPAQTIFKKLRKDGESQQEINSEVLETDRNSSEGSPEL